MTPEAVVQRQLDAYNAKNIEALMATYATDAEQFEHPAKLLASGTAQIRERFVTRFKESNLHAELINRIMMGNMIIDHERVTRTFPEGPGKIELMAIYEVQNDRIKNAWFIFGLKSLDKK
jgi:putative hydrolase of HD superfamily